MGTDSVVAALTEELVATCRKAFQRGLVGGAGGNISVRVPDRDEGLISATGVSLGDITPATVVRVDLKGQVVEAQGGCRPSKETGFHVCIYRLRPQVGAVVHLHPPFATAFAVRGKELPLVTDGAMLNLKHVPVVGHAPSGSAELHRIVEEGLRAYPEARAILMERHGMFSMGPNLTVAYNLADLVEDTAKIALLSRLIPG
ncbi:MAG TPA: class II aldolase/adducin family protein [Candidatus Methylomirabilis sp.]|nr:class II aldolase/adducin family protein [Candidatus Methylomirabilis sp.]